MTLKRRQNGYWNDEMIIFELKTIIKNLGHFPTAKELRIIDREDLRTSIYRNGGLNHYRKLLGYESLQKPVVYQDEMNVTSGLKLVIKELGRFPLKRELFDMGKRDLATAITKYGGFIKFRILLGNKTIQ